MRRPAPTPNLHTCPEPFDRETAEWLRDLHSAPGAAPISMRMKGRIVMGLKQGQN